MSGAPTVLNMIVNTPSCDRKPLPHKVMIVTGGSPPLPQIISRMEEMGFEVNHIYGLTETYGPEGTRKDQKATDEAFRGGWFHSGDLAVKHPDGYIEVQDRSKDIIISGGENISTIEVETVLYRHPAVLEAAIVARPDNHWGQTPCAFVKLKEGFDVSSREIINFCRDNLPHYMAPRTVIFQDLPKSSTGKIQKSILREKAKVLGSLF
ncbi:hypothetical protein H5410_006084 [Solanum commersonii]|uniref:Uncharacterized protein n=1 Tax=Solanum commersonii TaxID=4109 RepID=A0A9J6A9C9_SOLCO|nr:hypothetical protein H5410_006084 [Solanum commersonii]